MLHINRFLDRLQQASGRRQKDIVMSLSEAHDLHTDITKLLVALEDLRERVATADNQQVIEVQVQGGSF
jgi:hypothetical protein